MASNEGEKPAVRFSSNDEQIDPKESLEKVETLSGPQHKDREDLGPEAEEELKNLKVTLQKSRQQHRFENFSFEPVSLPASRVPSNNSSQAPGTSSKPSPHNSPSVVVVHSPPLTPSASTGNEEHASPGGKRRSGQDAGPVTPQESPPVKGSKVTRPRSMIDMPSSRAEDSKDRRDSQEGTDRDSRAASTGGASGPHSRSVTPVGDPNDPYAKGKRATQVKGDAIDSRFVFQGRDPRRSTVMFGGSTGGSTAGLPRSTPGSSTDLASKEQKDKRRSFFGQRAEEMAAAAIAADKSSHSHSSMSELKRFFRLGHHKKDKDKRGKSPVRGSVSGKSSGTRTPPSSTTSSAMNLPFADDHGLQSKYGKFGKVLGSGAGGSVRLMKRSSDGVTFAVKQFRARHSYETEKEYSKKVTAEFCIGSTLHHGNIIETMDIIYEKGNWYEVMEYAPYDLFAIVMTGKMSRDEVTCCTLQILSGVSYIHGMGLAHRDLKLDNVVVNEHGIMKIIDFGSAAVFRYPFENEVVLATGIVGSDPYLAPEVYDLPKYDARPTDIWSMAIIFCCMMLRRFPWKAPRLSDNSYKLFVAEPDDDSRHLSLGGKGTHSEPASRNPSAEGDGEQQRHHHHHHHHHHHSTTEDGHAKSDPSSNAANGASDAKPTTSGSQAQQSQGTIKGPWRLLRLLPRETRHVVGRMLEVDPKKRATLEEIYEDKWVQNALVCRQEENGKVIRAPGHEHTLEPGSGGSGTASRK